MFEKVYFGGTYGYKDFINDDEKLELQEWILSEQIKMSFSQPVNSEKDQYRSGLKRHFKILYPNDSKPDKNTHIYINLTSYNLIILII